MKKNKEDNEAKKNDKKTTLAKMIKRLSIHFHSNWRGGEQDEGPIREFYAVYGMDLCKFLNSVVFF